MKSGRHILIDSMQPKNLCIKMFISWEFNYRGVWPEFVKRIALVKQNQVHQLRQMLLHVLYSRCPVRSNEILCCQNKRIDFNCFDVQQYCRAANFRNQ
jgi:hypothetical protein